MPCKHPVPPRTGAEVIFGSGPTAGAEDKAEHNCPGEHERRQHCAGELLFISTKFETLQGQPDASNVDLAELRRGVVSRGNACGGAGG